MQLNNSPALRDYCRPEEKGLTPRQSHVAMILVVICAISIFVPVAIGAFK